MGAGQDRGHGSGTGFVFTDGDPFFFLDIDGAYDPVTQQWSAVAVELCTRLAGAAVEVSMSGTGLHIIGRTAKPLDHACKNTPKGLELYTRARFVALTGLNSQGSADFDCTAALAAVVADYFVPSVTGDVADWTMEPVAEYTGPADDEALIAKALASGQRTFQDLWTANGDALGRKWPPNKHVEAFDASSADMALANMLAFWTGKNCDRMQRLMERSELNRSKWHVRPTYLSDTIKQACAFVQVVYTAKAEPAPLMEPPAPEVMLAAATKTGRKLREVGREFMGPAEQLEYFDQCFYDNTTKLVYSLPKNTAFEKGSFDINYGGHMFILDQAGSKSTDSAWEAYTKSRVNIPQIVDALCFRPELSPGELVSDGQRLYVNSYVPHIVRRVAGDPAPFLNHLAKLFPDENDRKIILCYMASMAQNPGHKFQWWPVIQGCEGNGKSLIGVLMTAILGEQYTHLPNAHKMAKQGSNFNSWIYRKLLIVVEEIMLANKRDFLEEFKVVVTAKRIEIEGKGVNQFTGDNRVNGYLFTNHKDGVPITIDTRRYAVFFTPQQEAEDLARDGLTTQYFRGLVDWIEGDGAAIMAEYLLSMQIEAEYDPAKLSIRAPKTTSTAEAIVQSLGRAEQEILDAINEGRPGFSGGWVSSKYLDQLLDQIKAPVPRNKRRGMMKALGYDYHPALTDGRTNDPVTPDAAKPRLYVNAGHLALNLKEPALVAKAYSAAQAPVVASAAVIAFGPKPG
jgi:hypothetical protein